MSGTRSFLILAQNKWIHVSHLEHSIIGRPANGQRQKQVTRFHDSSSEDTKKEIYFKNISQHLIEILQPNISLLHTHTYTHPMLMPSTLCHHQWPHYYRHMDNQACSNGTHKPSCICGRPSYQDYEVDSWVTIATWSFTDTLTEGKMFVDTLENWKLKRKKMLRSCSYFPSSPSLIEEESGGRH